MNRPLGLSIALPPSVKLSALRSDSAGKAVWGRAVLTILVAIALLPAQSAAASGPAPQSQKALSSQQAAARAARIARRHAKLDLQLNDAVEDAVNDDSNVIIEFNDETDAVNLVKGQRRQVRTPPRNSQGPRRQDVEPQAEGACERSSRQAHSPRSPGAGFRRPHRGHGRRARGAGVDGLQRRRHRRRGHRLGHHRHGTTT